MLSAALGEVSLRREYVAEGADVRGIIETPSGGVLVSRRRRFDLHMRGDHRAEPLTTDGRSIRGSLSANGSLLVVQRFLADAREVIVVRDLQGHERQMTAGPSDVAPAALPDGATWIHVRLNEGELTRCSVLDGRCSVIHRDPLMPGFTSVDPLGKQLAYVTTMGAPRVRTVSVSGGSQRDLGPAAACQPVWSSPSRLWVARSDGNQERAWTEIDVTTGLTTGLTLAAAAHGPDSDDCPLPAQLAQLPHVVGLVDESADLIALGQVEDRGAVASAPR